MVVALTGSNAATTGTISYFANAVGNDGPITAQADFTTSAGSLQITLTDTVAANVIRSAGQALSDITFTLSNAPGALGTTSATGQLGDVSGSGLVTYVTGTPTDGWEPGGHFTIVGNTITLETIGGGQPAQMIAPNIANGGTYTNVNNGFQNFNSYVIGPATFTLALTGVTADTTVTAATFSFGTNPDTFLPGTPGVARSALHPSRAGNARLGAGGNRARGYGLPSWAAPGPAGLTPQTVSE